MDRNGGSGSMKEELPEKRRRTQAKENKDAPRYECFCGKQYLSYPALYLHLKNKHLSYFTNSKGVRKVEATKLIETFDSTEGYKIFRIPIENINNMNQLDHEKKDAMTAKSCQQAGFPLQNPMFIPPNYVPYPFHYQFQMGGNIDPFKNINARQFPTEIAISMFMNTLQKASTKQKQQTYLFMSLLIDCINKNYHMLKDQRTSGKEIKRYTAQFNSECIFRIMEHFQNEEKRYQFFMNRSYIMTSEGYKKTLRDLHQYLHQKYPQNNYPPMHQEASHRNFQEISSSKLQK